MYDQTGETDEDLLGSNSMKVFYELFCRHKLEEQFLIDMLASWWLATHLLMFYTMDPGRTVLVQELKDYFRAMYRPVTEEDMDTFFVSASRGVHAVVKSVFSGSVHGVVPPTCRTRVNDSQTRAAEQEFVSKFDSICLKGSIGLVERHLIC